MRFSLRRVLAVIVLAVVSIGLGACGGGGHGDATVATPTITTPAGPPIRIGTKNFTEEFILGELYAQALKAKGFAVVLRSNIGPSEITYQALNTKAVDMYPEYVGTLLSEVANVTQRPSSPEAAYQLAKKFEERSGFTLLAPTPFSDSEALAVTPSMARRRRVHGLADLRKMSPEPKIGAPVEFESRFEGLVGLKKLYGLRESRFSALDFDKRYSSLDSGRVDVAAVFTTERQLSSGRYVVLTDPKHLFAVQHAAPIINQKALAAHGPRLRAVIDAVSAKLTTSAMRRMNGAVDIDHRTPRAVATEFLQAQGLL